MAASADWGYFKEYLQSKGYGRASLIFHQEAEPTTWDYKISYTASKKTTSVLDNYSVDGQSNFQTPIVIKPGESLNNFVEVKTFSPNNKANALTYVENGFNQAIRNAQGNPSTNGVRNVSTLMIDYDSYMNAYNANPSLITELYNKLTTEYHGNLKLVKGFFTKAHNVTQQAIEQVSSQTDKTSSSNSQQ